MNIKPAIMLFTFLVTNVLSAFGQQEVNNAKDTTYTISSAAKKILKEFTGAVLVNYNLPEEIEAMYDVVYKTIGKRRLSADVYYSKKETNIRKPVIFLIHGGGWRSGNKLMEKYTAGRLASLGYLCIAPEYRLSSESVYPAAILDIMDAINWVKKNDEKYSIDSSKIILMGESAGGHLASLAGINGKHLYSRLNKTKIHLPKICAVINIDGVMDMTVPSESGKDSITDKPSAAKQWIGFTYKKKPELWKEVSPVNHIDGNSSPMLFINSSIDRFHAGRNESVVKMKLWNIYSEVHTIPGSPHSFWFFHPWIDEAIDHINSFLNKIFLNSKVTN